MVRQEQTKAHPDIVVPVCCVDGHRIRRFESRFDMNTLYFLRGLLASGKTTWAKQKLAALNSGGKRLAVRTNKDEIRARLRAKGIDSESKVVGRETELVTKALKAGKNVIVDNTHFKPLHEWRYRHLAKEYGYSFEIVSFTDIPIEECIRRDAKRRNGVGQIVIQDMDYYRRSLRPRAVAELKKEWLAKMARAAARAEKKAATQKSEAVVAEKIASRAVARDAVKTSSKKRVR
jgi:predicted kinase